MALYAVGYQIPQTNSDGTWLTDHADPVIFYVMMILTLLLLLLPFIPGLRSIPKWIPIHRRETPQGSRRLPHG